MVSARWPWVILPFLFFFLLSSDMRGAVVVVVIMIITFLFNVLAQMPGLGQFNVWCCHVTWFTGIIMDYRATPAGHPASVFIHSRHGLLIHDDKDLMYGLSPLHRWRTQTLCGMFEDTEVANVEIDHYHFSITTFFLRWTIFNGFSFGQLHPESIYLQFE